MATVTGLENVGKAMAGDKSPVGNPGLVGITWHPMIATTLDAQLAALSARHKRSVVTGHETRTVAVERRALANRVI
jgi:hypothetical protein